LRPGVGFGKQQLLMRALQEQPGVVRLHLAVNRRHLRQAQHPVAGILE
jgi:hypothetical protein